MCKFANSNIIFFKATPSKNEYKISSNKLVYFKGDEIRYKDVSSLSKFINALIIGAREDSKTGRECNETLLAIKFGLHESIPQLHQIDELTD